MWNSLQKLIQENEIFSIDLRFTDIIGNWHNITLPVAAIKDLADLNKVCKKLKLKLLQDKEIRHFIDPFLAHPTLVCLTDLEDFTVAKKIDSNTIYNIEFYLESLIDDNAMEIYTGLLQEDGMKTQQPKQSQVISLLAPPEDIWRDIRTEIVLATGQMGVNIVKHYANFLVVPQSNQSNYQNIIKIITNNSINLIDDIQKVKYAIAMVAKAYNIKVENRMGIFANFKDFIK